MPRASGLPRAGSRFARRGAFRAFAMPTNTHKFTISALANMALLELENLCGAHYAVPCFGYTESPLGLFLGGTLIDTELKAIWELPPREAALRASCRLALTPLARDFATMQAEHDGEPSGGWQTCPSYRACDLIFAVPALDGRSEQATAYDPEGGALRATLIQPGSVEICVNLGARLQLQCRA